MNKRKRKHLMEKMIGILLLGFFLALLLFLLIFFMGNGALNRYFESSMYRRNVSKETIAMFQEYVSRHHLAASDTERIREWAKENHIGYFTISRKSMLLWIVQNQSNYTIHGNIFKKYRLQMGMQMYLYM